MPHGVDRYLRAASAEAAKTALRQKLGLPRPYILFLGGITPLKNIGNLLRAFARVAGHPRRGSGAGRVQALELREELAPIRELGLEDRVRYVGYVADEDLAAIYSAAECLALPSWYEGFGIPIVEAMACGCPVVTSSGRHAAPEVAGGAAVLVDPADPEAIAGGLSRVLDDPRAACGADRQGPGAGAAVRLGEHGATDGRGHPVAGEPAALERRGVPRAGGRGRAGPACR